MAVPLWRTPELSTDVQDAPCTRFRLVRVVRQVTTPAPNTLPSDGSVSW